MKNNILEKISHAPLEKILDMDNFKDIDWIWVNREIFLDILLNLKLDEELEESELDEVLNQTKDDEMIKALTHPFKEKGYVPMNQYQFATIEKGYKPTRDIETTIFAKQKIHRKLLIKLMRNFEWILKAMAMDTYFKMGLDYNSLKETYDELYKENNRILEEVISSEEYSFVTGTWKFNRKTQELYYYKAGELYNIWAEGQANAKFREMVKK